MMGLWGLIASSKLVAARHHWSSMCLAATRLHRALELASASCSAISMMLSKADRQRHRDAGRGGVPDSRLWLVEVALRGLTICVQRCICSGAKAW
jgi:hypothetical protein